ncbi:MAG: T9SS C-terminal target domain-containing protein [Polyangiaceae bacterium]|nr:T9SS C-terminal target domain-containing protein [Polyangiaceae bacterium]
MRLLPLLLSTSVTGLLVGAAACGSSNDDQPAGTGGTTTTSTSTTSNSGGSGAGKPTETVTGDVAVDTTLGSDKNWLLEGTVRVLDGATLTIEAGTTVLGDKASMGTLVIEQGGSIVADGTASEPIVFTSALPAGQRAPGDWGGLVVLGRAPINEPGGTASVEGFTTAETYGGTDPNDSSGSLSYLRIEFSGIEIAPDNEINGLTLAGVGRGTSIDHVMVRHTLDDCFEWFGGTVDASYLICDSNGDDGFDIDQGYVGRLQFLFLHQSTDSDSGIEADNDTSNPAVTPVTDPTIYNVTLCGPDTAVPNQQSGMLLRRGFNGTFANFVVTGFEGGVDVRDKPFTDVALTHATFFGNAPENVAYAEDGSNTAEQADDDAGFDERAWFAGGAGNTETDPGLVDCFGATPDARPGTELTGTAPPADGFFDASAGYRGAFRDGSDAWATGAWVSWAPN